MKILNQARHVFDLEVAELKKVCSRLGEEFEQVCTTILNCHGKVVITGVGKSGLIGGKIAATLASTGTYSVFMHATEGLHGDLGMLRRGDIVIAISNSGSSDEVLAILPSIKQIGATLIALTGNIHSPLALAAEYILDVGVEAEACPMNLAPTCSTTATLVMGDAIAAVLIEERKFQPENFALYHPGGSLGRRLLTRVRDVMHCGSAIPTLTKDATADDVLMTMSRGHLGAVCIVDSDNQLQGIITEGDIRRALTNREKFFLFTAEDMMNKNPISISPETMAVDAMERMENRESQISVLPVIEENVLVGLIRIHDLLMVR